MLKQIGRYEIEQVLGSGGMATVYLGRDPLIKRRVAIKLMAHQLVHDQKLRQRFYQEAELIAALENPNIVDIYDFGEEEGQPFLVMPYLTGGSLRGRLNQRREQNQPYSLPELLPLLEKIAQALQTAHQENIVHRDVKPDNVLFDRQGNPYLSDFGIARQEGVTFNTMMLGTPTYISPEQSRNSKEIDGRSDIYSLTAMAFELLALRPPFEASDMVDLMRLHREAPIPNLCQLRPDLPAAIQAVLEKGMAKEPNQRYATAPQFVAALQSLNSPAQTYVPTVIELLTPTPKSAMTPPPAPTPAPLPTPPPSLNESWATARSPLLFMGVGLGLAFLLFLLCGVVAWPSVRRAVLAQPTGVATQTLAELPTSTATPTLPTNTPAPSNTPTETATPTLTVTPTRQPTNTPTATLAAGDVRLFALPGGGGEVAMVYVPEGNFLMGSADSDSQAGDDEFPQHTVFLADFFIDRTEVTNGQFAAFVADRGYETTAEQEGSSLVCANGDCNQVDGADWRHPQGPSSNLDGLLDHPVVQVSWVDADAFCEWRGASLPTEAQWEKAARGTDERIYPWGNTFDGSRLNFCDRNCQWSHADTSADDGYALTAPVGSYPNGASPYGALDMAGNVWEWVADWYDSDYYDTSPDANPTGPSSGDYRVVRGGSWLDFSYYTRAAGRPNVTPDFRYVNFGFRCVALPGVDS